MIKNLERHFVLDVESDGPCPGLYNMISFGICSVKDPTEGIYILLQPDIQNAGIPEARAVSGISYEEQVEDGISIESAMSLAASIITQYAQSERVTFWSDNPAFDWQFWNYYCHKYIGHNPAGFSARRIGDFDAGRRKNFLNTNAWKKWRKTGHTHNPLEDAMGNAEALNHIIELIRC